MKRGELSLPTKGLKDQCNVNQETAEIGFLHPYMGFALIRDGVLEENQNVLHSFLQRCSNLGLCLQITFIMWEELMVILDSERTF